MNTFDKKKVGKNVNFTSQIKILSMKSRDNNNNIP